MVDFALIVAGGTGSRMQSDLPKQFLDLGGVPILMRTIHAFALARSDVRIVVAIPSDQHDFWIELCHRKQFHVAHDIVAGGHTRFQSVKSGLDWITRQLDYTSSTSIISVHDGARPLVKPQMIRRIFELARDQKAVVPGIEPVDSVRLLTASSNQAIARDTIRYIQTPQGFIGEYLEKAYQQEESFFFTDDASVVEKMGIPIHLTDGDPHNIKITTPTDLTIAMIFLEDRQS